jgi:hypothetical protein
MIRDPVYGHFAQINHWIEEKDGKHILAGKGQFVYDYMEKSGRPIVHDGYQLFWKW